MSAPGIIIRAAALFLLVALVACSSAGSPPSQAGFDWRSDWTVQSGFNIQTDAQGFQFPTSIAFVPHPGPAPKDPLYFVTEIRGGVKVVTNDRSVFTFAEDFFRLRPRHELPSGSGEVGLAGLCLDAGRGYVFVTFAYQDADNVLRNNVVRFQSTPETFSLSPSAQLDFTEVFAPYRSVVSHQIGPCQVRDGLLYISAGDGQQPQNSQRLDSLLGKVLRMTLDGKPVPGNPFFQDDDIKNAANYVWAYGLRNPFGLKTVGDGVFVADNGPSLDRFLQVTEGSNYLWGGGSNVGIATNADWVIFPGKGVAQIDYYPQGSNLFPSQFKDSFFLTISGSSDQRLERIPAVWIAPYDLRHGKLTAVASPLVQYRGEGVQVVAGLAFGPDGLYFVPLFPNREGTSAVLRVVYDPAAGYPFLIEAERDPTVLMNTLGCFACHQLGSEPGGTIGPALDRDLLVPRIQQRLNSSEYTAAVAKLDSLEEEPFLSFREARRSVQRAEGLTQVKLWLESRIQEPRFDDPDAQMPKLGVSQEQAAIISSFLAGIEEDRERKGVVQRIRSFVGDRLPDPPRQKHLVYFFASGLLLGGLAAGAAFWAYVRLRRGRGGRPT